MKRLKFYALLMPLTLGVASLASCSSDSDNNSGQGHPESGDVTSYDQVRYLQNNIVEIDSLGNMVQRVSGIPLDNSDTTVLSIKVADVEAAKKMFVSWLSPDTKTELISPSTVDVKAALADGDGKVKDTVYFKAVTSGKEVAEMTFAKSDVFKHFSKIQFVTGWPSPFKEGRTPYHVGEFENYPTFEEGTKKWVCVREAKDGVSGMLMYISGFTGHRYGVAKLKSFASPSLARAASEELRQDWDRFVGYFKAADQDLVSGEYFWINDYKFYLVAGGPYAIRLSDGDVDWFDFIYKDPRKRYIQIRTFGYVNN